MNYIKYKRFFVPLKGAEQGAYGGEHSENLPTGHLKIETGNRKGAMSCTVRNLKKEEGPCRYKLIFFGTQKEKTIYALAGDLAVDREGRGETHFRFDPENFDGKGNSLDRFSLIVAAAVPSEKGREAAVMEPVLTGVPEWEEKPAGSAVLVNGSEPGQRPAAGSEGDAGSGDTALGVGAEPVSAAGLEQGAASENGRSEEVGETEGAPEAAAVKAPNYNGFYNRCLLRFCEYTCNVSGYYKDVTPFACDETGAEWKRMANVGNLPLVSPGAHYFATQCRHYLFGVKKGEHDRAERYFFAVPGRNLKAEQPDGGESGFLLWQAIAQGDGNAFAEKQPGMYGYWITAVNGVTGDIEAP